MLDLLQDLAKQFLQCLSHVILPALPPKLAPKQSASAAGLLAGLVGTLDSMYADASQRWQQFGSTAGQDVELDSTVADGSNNHDQAVAGASSRSQQPSSSNTQQNGAAPSAYLLSTSMSMPGAWHDELVQLSISYICQLLARCEANDQKALAITACEWLVSCSTALPPTQTPTQSSRVAATASASAVGAVAADSQCSVHVALGSAVLAALWPEDLQAGSVQQLLGVLTQHVTDWHLHRIASDAAAVALAAVASKWQGGAGDYDQVMEQVLGVLLWSFDDNADEHKGSNGVESTQLLEKQQRAVLALSWLARALTMRKSSLWQGIVVWAIKYLQGHPLGGELPTETTAGSQQEDTAATPPRPGPLLQAVAGLFEVLVSDTAQVAGLSFDDSIHVTAKPLWCQRTFTMTLSMLKEACDTAAATQQGVTSNHPAAASQQATLSLWLACAHLLQGAPSNVLRSAAGTADTVANLLVQCVCHISSSMQPIEGRAPAAFVDNGSTCVQLLDSCLLLLSDFLLDAQQCHLLEGSVNELIDCLLLAAPLPSSASVRETALQCLVAVTDFPWHLLFPHRKAVLKVVYQAMDDDKRSVRKAAVGCRRVWSNK